MHLMVDAILFKVAYCIVASFPGKLLVAIIRFVDNQPVEEYNYEISNFSRSLTSKQTLKPDKYVYENIN